MTCELEEYIIDTCEDLQQASGMSIEYADGQISIDDDVIYAGTALKCGYVIAGMYIMLKLLNAQKEGEKL